MLIQDAWGIVLCLLLGILLDLALGEVRKFHPLVGFGNLANAIELLLNKPTADRWTGALALCLAVLPLVALSMLALLLAQYFSLWLAAISHFVLLYFCLGLRSLHEHNAAIATALQTGDLAEARKRTSYIVSRDTENADEAYLAKASVESVLENGCDAVFATLFWFILLGGPGAVLYRLVNTLDAMWGYRSTRFLRFGCVAARADDVMNWIPARLTACTYAILGKTRLAWQCWQRQAPGWPSPNAGPVMAAGAGALGLALGGAASYDGVAEVRPPLGEGDTANAADILRALRLVETGAALWCGVALLAAIFLSGVIHA
ncbi:adenosylcobinamide-phosphate synthase CbiB [Undibacterium umbellatum]|uniref:Cobalamin biosynthesis protein CobD n=1 Tax=Undibacterium umbellatum TaxID=2762300 RepID=A0ABR6ZA99_9BURK|nr:adenosylcobinamide-phosphate synthase CbiB [Undibacterium umbellatum]MBC3908692.1 cobalamin biosynthesis protein [Undibacterium umbellatum]